MSSPFNTPNNVGELLDRQGISRRTFLKYCATVTSLLALPPAIANTMAENLAKARRLSVIWLSFQECTACTESILRSDAPDIENLLFNFISLDYHHALQAAAGHYAEAARKSALEENKGEYIVVVDGSIPLKDDGVYSTVDGHSNYDILVETAEHAKAIIAVGTCAAFGGLPKAHPNPTGAASVMDIIKDKPIINISGCPPIPTVMTAVLSHVIALGKIPELDHLLRPKAFFGETIHDRCYRRPFYDKGMFAKSFDDEGARKGYCLFELGCKGPVAYNACATMKWNQRTSFPIESGHGCFACSEPNFWDQGGIYNALSQPTQAGGAFHFGGALLAGAAVGLGAAALAKSRRAALVNPKDHYEGEKIL